MTGATLTGARESSAGDEFHVLWAVRRVLGLLDPASGLERVVMEDLTPVPPEGVAPELLLAADLTEFYGGTELPNASRVVVSQLKYSHRHPERTWTAARLAAPSSHGKKGVIARMADLYAGIAATGSREEVIGRVEIRLVSNMPCAGALMSALTVAKAWLAARPGPAARAALLRALNKGAREQIERLSEASGLRSLAFTDFLRVLDLSYTGAESRAEQELRVTQALSEHVMADLRHASLALAELVRKRGLPEGVGKPIECADVLAALEVRSAFDLLPAPPQFTGPAYRVRTPDAVRICEALADAPDRRVLAHGVAGVGKTTTILALERELPAASVVITYDCFGDGDYETPGAGRHDPLRFALQLCNELAARCRLPVLVRPSPSIHDLWRELERRVEAAASLLAEQGARLVIVVDAADNSAWAGRHFGEETFLRRLWSQPVPMGAGLVVTCRTGRRDAVDAPPEVAQILLNGFDEAASAEYLRARFPEASDDDARAFHANSEGNPRVQFYVLFEERAGAATTIAEAVEQANLTPNDLFENLLAAAVAQAPNVTAARERMAELVCLTKPLTTGRFRAVSGMAAARVRAFCESLVPGVLIEGDVIAFRDEDFANFLRAKVGEAEEAQAHSRLADLFLGRPGDDYAATVVADHLHNAGRGVDLAALALTGAPEAIADGLARQQAYRRRLALALRHAANVADRAVACRLVILAGEAARQNQAVAEILRRRPDLGMRYSDPEAVMRVYTSAEKPEWQGPIHMQLAALYARMRDPERARSESRAAQAWLVRRQEEDEDWRIEADDVAAYAEAWFHVHGADAAEEQLRRWRPTGFALASAVALVRRLALAVPGEELGGLIAARELPAAVRARLLAAAFGAGAVPATASVRTVAKQLLNERPTLETADGWWAATFAELAAYVGLGPRRVLALVKALRLPQPRSAPHRFERLGRHRDPLRLAALRAAAQGRKLELEELMPASVTDPPDDSRTRPDIGSERRDMHETVGRYVDVFASRARMLLMRPPVAELRAEWENHLQGKLRDRPAYRREPNYGYRTWLAAFTDAVLACEGTDAGLVALAGDVAEQVAGGGAYACWLAAARRLVRDERYRREGLLLIERAAAAIEAAEWPASQHADSLLDACAIADPIDDAHARDLHARAIHAAEGMDDEAIGRLELHAQLAASIAGTPAAATLAWRTTQALIAHRNRVTDEDHLPWRQTLRAAALLHPQTALALVARLEDDCHMYLHATVPTVACPLVNAGFLEPAQALALLPLAGENTAAIDAATELLERMPQGPERSVALGAVSLRIRRDVLPDARPGAARALIEWATEHSLAEAQAVASLRPYCTPPTTDDEERPTSRRWSGGESEWDRRARLADDILARAGSADPASVDRDLAELAGLYGAERIPKYLKRVSEGLVPSQRAAFVDALGAVGADHPVARFHADDVLEALIRAARDWGRSQALRARIAAAIIRFVETHFGGLTEYGGLTPQVVGKLLALDVLGDPADLLLRTVGSSLERLDAPTLFATASQLALTLERDERAGLLDWSLDGVESEPVAAPQLPAERAEVLASLMWSLFGAPDKATRWRAAHVMRSLVTTGDAPLARALFERTTRRDAGPFASDTLPFHWLSAQVWTLMVIARVACDKPECVAALAPELAAIARDRSWPHVGVREFARRGALHVAAAVPGALAPDLVGELELANMPRACKRERAEYFYGRTGAGNRDYETERFHFDSMDTLPYVYGPFGARFGMDVDEVCDRAERWIVDRLGLSDIRPVDRRLEILDYSQRDNHHGASPRGESWHQMLEEHALQLVAGELCDEGAVIEGEHGDGPDDPWASWLSDWTDALEHAWLADERGPVPPVPALLLHDLARDDWPELTDAELIRAIGADDPETLIVDAAVEFSSGFGWGSTYVTSALVSAETAPALVRAFMAMDDPRRFGLPQEGDYGPSDQDDIELGEFRLEGWIWETDRGEPGLEEHDPLRRIRLSVTRPGTRFLEVCRGRLERGGRLVRGPDGRPIAWQRVWSDIETVGAARREPHGTKGLETYVRRDALCEVLRATPSQLIIKAWASRHKRGRNYLSEEDETNEQTIHRVYLFDPDTGLVG